jgi:prevent-host-death family protein
MAEIGAYDAKTHLSELLQKVQQGERFLITRHGQPVAELAPIAKHDQAAVQQRLERMREWREKFSARGITLQSLLKEGQTARELLHEDHRY